MRAISTLVLLLLLTFSASSQSWKITTAYSLGFPQGEMNKNINAVHALQAGFLYQLPNLKNLSVGAELGIGLYAMQRIQQTFNFDDNTSAVVPVNYNSNVFNANLQARFSVFADKKLVNPYVQAKGGLFNFFSTVRIEDPEDPTSCHALDRDNILNDKTLYWSAGGGLQIDVAAFSKKGRRGALLIDLGANTIRGGSVNYINTKNLVDAQTVNDPAGKPLNVRFVNASTQDIHEHTVAQVYTSPLNILEFRIGIVAAIGKCK